MKTERSRFEVVEAAVDWLTWITPRTGDRQREIEMAQWWVEEQRQKGCKVRPFAMFGYTGQGVDGCAFGLREDTTYLRLSGSLAALRWYELSSVSGSPSRIDVQTTCLLRSAERRFGTRVLARTKTAPIPHRGRPPKRACFADNRGAWCGTVGTRANPIYLRVYDKGVESGSHQPGMRWRIELEAKAETAKKLWSEAIESQDRTKWCMNVCERTIAHVGGTWPFPKSGGITPLPTAEPRVPAEVEGKLKWLREQVAPSIEHLVPFVGVEELLETLGLDGYAQAFVTTNDKEVR